MDWKVSFIPNDLNDLSLKELDRKVNPKITMNVRFGKGRIGAGFPVLIEDMSFHGHLRVKIKFMSKFPFAKLVDMSFLEKPQFDYVLKPLGTDSFGFDVNLVSYYKRYFIKERAHFILCRSLGYKALLKINFMLFWALSCMLLMCLHLTLKRYSLVILTLVSLCSCFLTLINSPFLTIGSANGVLAVTVYSATAFENVDDLLDDNLPNTYIRFYLDHGQELDRTSVYEHSFSPQWNETKFLMLNSLNSLLSVELKASRPGLKDRRLGTANFDLSKLDNDMDTEQKGL